MFGDLTSRSDPSLSNVFHGAWTQNLFHRGRHKKIHFDSHGGLDTAFADHGTLIERIDNAGVTVAPANALDKQGRLMVAGYNGGRRTKSGLGSFDDHSLRVVLLRYTPKGKLDLTFGNDGVAVQMIESDNHANRRFLQEYLRDDFKSVGLLLGGDGRTTVAAANAEGDTTYLMSFDERGKPTPTASGASLAHWSVDAIDEQRQ